MTTSCLVPTATLRSCFSPLTLTGFHHVCRLVELAPQYYLGNLPPSDGKELLMELRRSLVPQRVPEEHSHAQRGGAEADGAPCEPAAERCLIQ